MRNPKRNFEGMTWIVRAMWGSIPLSIFVLTIGFGIKIFNNTAWEIMIAHLYIMIVITLSFQIFTGNSGVISYGHIGFMAIGAYVSALLTIPPEVKGPYLPDLPPIIAENQLNVFIAMGIAILAVGILAFLIGIPIVRMSNIIAGGPVVTFAFLVVVATIIGGWQGITAGRRALYGVPTKATIGWISVVVVFCLVLSRVFRDSPTGLQLRASREDEVAAKAMGVNLANVRLSSWVISAMFAATGGALLGHYFGVFSPAQFWLATTINALAMMLVGGLTTTSGSVIGAFILTIVLEATRYLESAAAATDWLPDLFGLAQIIVGVIFLLMLYSRSDGIMGRWELDEHIKSWRSRSKQVIKSD